MNFILVGAILIIIVLIMYVISLRYQVKRILQQLKKINNNEVDIITLPLINKDTISIASEINKMIRKNQKNNLAIRKKDRSLKRTIANLSHDFRTPLTSIIGYLQLLDRSNMNEKQLTYMDIISNKSNELRNLADMFFQLSIIELDEMRVNLKRENIGNLLTNIIIDNVDLIENNGFLLDVYIDKKPSYVYIDDSLLNRVLQNLLTNSIKYGVDKLKISLTNEGEFIKIIFKNNIQNFNIDINSLFHEFYTIGNSGTGLGLSISKSLVEKMGGKIKALKEEDSLIIEILFKSLDKK
ncbi:sensor histidine kinase [Clostridium chrysemydis]|uniref:sensor histidine kinase n=1 Tax=Clostridium chrysemydis TaxID=2665504 RepID=UPI001883CCF0|nr:HAMP domain-containing sensor histidine kinase [Clostridium chrysemydis]